MLEIKRNALGRFYFENPKTKKKTTFFSKIEKTANDEYIGRKSSLGEYYIIKKDGTVSPAYSSIRDANGQISVVSTQKGMQYRNNKTGKVTKRFKKATTFVGDYAVVQKFGSDKYNFIHKSGHVVPNAFEKIDIHSSSLFGTPNPNDIDYNYKRTPESRPVSTQNATLLFDPIFIDYMNDKITVFDLPPRFFRESEFLYEIIEKEASIIKQGFAACQTEEEQKQVRSLAEATADYIKTKAYNSFAKKKIKYAGDFSKIIGKDSNDTIKEFF